MTIDQAVRNRFGHCRTLAFGSTISGLGSDTSDMDLCVFCDYASPVSGRKGSGKKQKQQANVDFLAQIRKLLK